jgi:hypothetical protein
MSGFIMNREKDVKSQIKRMIETNTYSFKEGSETKNVTKAVNVSITSLTEFNSDIPELDNYEFEGTAYLSISNGDGTFFAHDWIIEGTAKVREEQPIDIRIREPVSIRKHY